jgi:hypothetical protein
MEINSIWLQDIFHYLPFFYINPNEWMVYNSLGNVHFSTFNLYGFVIHKQGTKQRVGTYWPLFEVASRYSIRMLFFVAPTIALYDMQQITLAYFNYHRTIEVIASNNDNESWSYDYFIGFHNLIHCKL